MPATTSSPRHRAETATTGETNTTSGAHRKRREGKEYIWPRAKVNRTARGKICNNGSTSAPAHRPDQPAIAAGHVHNPTHLATNDKVSRSHRPLFRGAHHVQRSLGHRRLRSEDSHARC